VNTPSADIVTFPRAPDHVRSKLQQLEAMRNLFQRTQAAKTLEYENVSAYLGIADSVDQALDRLSEQLFGRIVTILEEKLTLALHEVLEQPIALKVNRDYKRGGATMSFHIERNGQPEDIMKGQGGSVANILSVGLRIFALTTLDPAVHRRFLVLEAIRKDCQL
jgi:hypothetical protein